jgi:hypothetical protein
MVIMSCLFSFLPSIFRRTTKPDCIEKTADHKDSGTLDAPERRTTPNASAIDITSISERETISLGASLSRIWTRLKYDSELRKAASDCRKFLASLSRPDFELSTATRLCGPLENIQDPSFKVFYEKSINDTIEKFAKEARKNDRLEQIKENLEKNMSRFDNSRVTAYSSAFRMAKECEKALATNSESKPMKAAWIILVKTSKS